MTQNKYIYSLTLVSLIVLLLLSHTLFADDNQSEPSQRPAPVFDHDLHEEAVDEPGCGACHHSFDEAGNKLIYSEGDEAGCAECHEKKAVDNVLALREANHASCTACHRKLIKLKKQAGPTTCGECHKK